MTFFFLLAALSVAPAPADGFSAAHFCYAQAEDRDGDGYARDGAAGSWTNARLCPAGFVEYGGDCDDSDPSIHPYNEEKPFDGVDQDCDGKADQMGFVYPDEVTRKVTLELRHRHVASGAAQARVEAAKLAEPDATQDLGVAAIERGEIEVDGLAANEVYRLRFQLQDSRGKDLETSGWYYLATAGSSRLESARAETIRLALHEWDESERGRTGYRGSVAVDGTRYDTYPGELWCSEFYAWVSKPWFPKMAGLGAVYELLAYFGSFQAERAGEHILAEGKPGDYLAIDTPEYGEQGHSGRLLAIERAGDGPYLWTVEGNWLNKTVVKRRKFHPARFRLGKLTEAQLE